MEYARTEEQKLVLEAELVPMKVVACAGSGKTATAVRRLLEVRQRMAESRSYAVLLSYSNTAVDTFREEYEEAAKAYKNLSKRVLICTVDSFLTTYVLAPHAHHVMGCKVRPFLVHGRELFLRNSTFQVVDGDRRMRIVDLDVRLLSGGELHFVNPQTLKKFPFDGCKKAALSLAATGAYSHALGRLWAVLTLQRTKGLSPILAKKFAHILVDEAQDIGSLHGKALLLLQRAGSVLTLVGDPHQAIFEFADSDGSFLSNFAIPGQQFDLTLTENRRSVKEIVDLANKVSGRSSTHIRVPPIRRHGAFYLKYDTKKLPELIGTFLQVLRNNDYRLNEAAILTRGKSLALKIGGGKESFGAGATKLFAEAAVARDVRGDISKAFNRSVDAFLRLFNLDDIGLRTNILSGERSQLSRALRGHIWKFLKDSAAGVPDANTPADRWHSTLKERLIIVIPKIENECGLTCPKSWVNNLTKRDLGKAPLYQGRIMESDDTIRVSTVHKAKGEGIAAILYVTTGESLAGVISGPVDEEGRIGYVALTRARDLLLLAIPKRTDEDSLRALATLGFVDASSAITNIVQNKTSKTK
ncbi:ATP-dependent helicase [Burkholderia sp. LMU1-1-1.1]|uniref:ATP-dependent helicase n=1 Tax=Burkholderia sp. LMU1-1-1.1 TaxID=3135266 RepID=UPI00344A137D